MKMKFRDLTKRTTEITSSLVKLNLSFAIKNLLKRTYLPEEKFEQSYRIQNNIRNFYLTPTVLRHNESKENVGKFNLPNSFSEIVLQFYPITEI